MGTDSKNIDNLVKIHLEEYRSLMNELLKRIEFEDRLLTNTILIPGLFVTALSSSFMRGNYNILLLLSPLIFYGLGLIYTFNDYTIVTIARYLNKFLRPKLVKLLDVDKDAILEYEDYQYETRIQFKKTFIGKLYSALKGILMVIAPVVILSFFIFLNQCLSSIKPWEWSLFFFDIILGVISYILRVKIWNQKWKTIAK